MALTITEVTLQLTTTREEINRTKERLAEKNDKAVFDKLLEDCEEHKKQLEKEIKSLKMKKFQRDRKDYEGGTVYKWRVPSTEAETQTCGRKRS